MSSGDGRVARLHRVWSECGDGAPMAWLASWIRCQAPWHTLSMYAGRPHVQSHQPVLAPLPHQPKPTPPANDATLIQPHSTLRRLAVKTGLLKNDDVVLRPPPLIGILQNRHLTSNSAVPMAMEPSMSMATREGEREAATPNPCEKTRSGTLPQGSNTR
eukprot:COSAG02_NODE_2466_length_8783_cov_405.845463_2_plen_159_part_00